jgi:hypothetical protein
MGWYLGGGAGGLAGGRAGGRAGRGNGGGGGGRRAETTEASGEVHTCEVLDAEGRSRCAAAVSVLSTVLSFVSIVALCDGAPKKAEVEAEAEAEAESTSTK